METTDQVLRTRQICGKQKRARIGMVGHSTVCPGSHFRETINNSFQNRPTDLAEGSLDAQLHARFNCVKNF